jgi:hypothetical protein
MKTEGAAEGAVICPVAESRSPGTLRFVTPPITLACPSFSWNCCTSESAASTVPLVLASRNFWITTDSVFVRPATCNVMVPL